MSDAEMAKEASPAQNKPDADDKAESEPQRASNIPLLSRIPHVLIPTFLAADAGDAEDKPAKRGRGRPKGSKNKPREGAASSSSVPVGEKRKRGRPPKVRTSPFFMRLDACSSLSFVS